MAKITRSDRRTDKANGRAAKGSTQTRRDRKDEHAALAEHHAKKAAEHARKAAGK